MDTPKSAIRLHGREYRRSVQIDLIKDEVVWALRVDVPRPQDPRSAVEGCFWAPGRVNLLVRGLGVVANPEFA